MIYDPVDVRISVSDPGGVLISGWGCAAASLEPLTYTRATILDKTVEKMSHSQTIFPNILAVPRPPFPLPLEAMLLCVLKQP